MSDRSFYDLHWTDTRSKDYYPTFDFTNTDFHIQEQALAKELRNVVPNQHIKVLELGMGFGRITKILARDCIIDEYLGIDISNEQIKNAKDYLDKRWEEIHAQSFVCDITKLSIINRHSYYDLVMAAETLMHIKPDDIERVIKLMVNSSKHDIINIDWNFDKIESDFCFIHDYHKLYTEAGAKLMNRIDLQSIKQSIFHYRVEK